MEVGLDLDSVHLACFSLLYFDVRLFTLGFAPVRLCIYTLVHMSWSLFLQFVQYTFSGRWVDGVDFYAVICTIYCPHLCLLY